MSNPFDPAWPDDQIARVRETLSEHGIVADLLEALAETRAQLAAALERAAKAEQTASLTLNEYREMIRASYDCETEQLRMEIEDLEAERDEAQRSLKALATVLVDEREKSTPETIVALVTALDVLKTQLGSANTRIGQLEVAMSRAAGELRHATKGRSVSAWDSIFVRDCRYSYDSNLIDRAVRILEGER